MTRLNPSSRIVGRLASTAACVLVTGVSVREVSAQTGACCRGDNGQCIDALTPAACAGIPGTYQGDGTTCAGVGSCVGACCAANDACTIENEHACTTNGRTYRGNGTDCNGNPCTDLGTEFTYQGRLVRNGQPLTDTCNLTFGLWSSQVSGALLGTQVVENVVIDGGLFAVQLDFGAEVFQGDHRWLAISVQCSGDISPVLLSPRQPITTLPYALQTRGIFVDEDANVGLGTTSPLHRLSVVGEASVTGNVRIGSPAASDEQRLAVASSSTTTFFANNTATQGVTYAAIGAGLSKDGVGVYGSSPGTGVVGYSTDSGGTSVGVYGLGISSSGLNIGIRAYTASPDGYSGFFNGVEGSKNYFQRDVGIGTLAPAALLDIQGRGTDAGGRPGFNEVLMRARNTSQPGNSAISIDAPTVNDNAILYFAREGSAQWSLEADYSSSRLNLSSHFGGPSQLRLTVTSSGRVGIGTNGPSEQLHVIGNIRASGNVIASCGTLTCSDRRFKKNVKALGDALDKVSRLNAVSYKWRSEDYPEHAFGDNRQIGLIAQDVREVLPEVVSNDSDGYLSVDYGRITPLLVEAVKELGAEAKAKDERIAELQAQNAGLSARLERLEKMMTKPNPVEEDAK